MSPKKSIIYAALLTMASAAYIAPHSISSIDKEYHKLSPTGMVRDILKTNPEWKFKVGDFLCRSSRSEEGVKWILSSAEDGYAEAQYTLARIYMHGIPGKVKENPLKALYWGDQAAQSGHVGAQKAFEQINKQLREK